jgi:hypothetical protein
MPVDDIYITLSTRITQEVVTSFARPLAPMAPVLSPRHRKKRPRLGRRLRQRHRGLSRPAGSSEKDIRVRLALTVLTRVLLTRMAWAQYTFDSKGRNYQCQPGDWFCAALGGAPLG